MRTALVVAAVLGLLPGCKSKTAAPSSEAPLAPSSEKKHGSDLFEDPSGLPESVDMAPPPDVDGGIRVDEAFFAKYLTAMADQLGHDARAASKRKFKDREEALQTLEGLTPDGFRISPETEKKLGLTDIDHVTLGPRMAVFAEAHPEVVERESIKLSKRLDRPLREVLRNIEKQFPDAGFAPGPDREPQDGGGGPAQP
jgi:hypothetical protein